MSNRKALWFKRKSYGWGWYPASWQGWFVTFAYVVLVVLASLTIDSISPMREVVFTFVLPVVLLTLAFIRIAYRKGEAPKWQWGRKDRGLIGVALFVIAMGIVGTYFLYKFQGTLV
ncbi:MAG: hypothetical protein WDZ61_00205 [Parcubacteria group bacterium]